MFRVSEGFFVSNKHRLTKYSTTAFSVIAAALVVSCANTDAAGQRALFDYVEKPDTSYSWRIVQRDEIDGLEIVELRLHSQTWRDILWRHRLFLIKPKELTVQSQALLTLSGGRWREAYDQPGGSRPLSENAGPFFQIAQEIGSVHIILDQVPFQPLFERTEDELIAYTLDRFLETQDSEWPLLLPMTKSAVRAMDAGQEAARELWGLELESFTLLGGSKRGWTTWLTAAADPRVTAMVPVVIDALNMSAHFPHQTDVWGSPSEEIRPYTDRNLDTVLSSEQGRELREIIDPFEYRDVLLQPKLIVNATNDAYFPVDSINLYWGQLNGSNYTLLLPNQGHSANDFGRLIPSLKALHLHAAGLDPMPSLDWEYERSPQGWRICLAAEPAPKQARIWSAVSEDRDFRDAIWEMKELGIDGPTLVVQGAREPESYAGFFVETVFESDDGRFMLSTTPAVLGPSNHPSDVWSAVSSGQVCD
jgi:PhoPQ-activated pathogenicity-related protein